MTHVTRCRLTLLEPLFFSSREVSNFYQTAPLIGNYALAYALGLVSSPYFNDGTIHYRQHFSQLNERGIYVTPATLTGAPRFTLAQFNAQPDAYWYAMANNVIVTAPEGAWAEKSGSKWYVKRTAKEKGKGVGLENRPQHGRIRFLSIGNEAIFYVVSNAPFQPPSYIRLGKFMSKARIESETVMVVDSAKTTATIPFLLNPADLPDATSLRLFDLISVPPSPLVQNSTLHGVIHTLQDGIQLPANMRFYTGDNA